MIDKIKEIFDAGQDKFRIDISRRHGLVMIGIRDLSVSDQEDIKKRYCKSFVYEPYNVFAFLIDRDFGFAEVWAKKSATKFAKNWYDNDWGYDDIGINYNDEDAEQQAVKFFVKHEAERFITQLALVVDKNKWLLEVL